MSCGINAQAQTHDRYTALILLCRYGYGEKLVDAVQLLVGDCKINPNNKTEHGSNAIHFLCQNPSLKSAKQFKSVVELLVNHGADAKAADGHGDTALTLLCRYSKISNLLDAIHFFVLDFQLEPTQTNQEGENALHSLCANESDTDLVSVARFLIVDRRVFVNTKVSRIYSGFCLLLLLFGFVMESRINQPDCGCCYSLCFHYFYRNKQV